MALESPAAALNPPLQLQTCETCQQLVAERYCPQCDGLSCAECDQRAHATAALASHARLPAAHSSTYRVFCTARHGLGLSPAPPPRIATLVSHYCRSCRALTCPSCQAAGGAHISGHAMRHECVTIEEEFRAAVAALQKVLGEDAEKKLELKKQYLQNELSSLSGASQSLDATCASIEAEESVLMQQRLDRLNQALQYKQIKISAASDKLKAELSDIDSFLKLAGIAIPASPSPADAAALSSSPASAATPTPASMCRLLSSSHSLLPRASALATPLPASALTAPALSPLPREAEARAAALAQFPRALALLRVKDELLRFAQASRKGLVEQQQRHAATLAKLYESTQQEMQQWVALSQRLTQEARAMKQHCAFCGVQLSGPAASTPCAANQPQAPHQALAMQQMTGLESTERRQGDGMHFFVQS